MGSDLWIIGDLAESAWARKIDWYLNFQLSRAAHHARRDVSPELAATAESWEFDPPVIASRAAAPLLVASAKFLPNQMTVQIESAATDWIRAAAAVTSGLRARSVRLFLPASVDFSKFSALWGQLEVGSTSQLTVVLDQGARSN